MKNHPFMSVGWFVRESNENHISSIHQKIEKVLTSLKRINITTVHTFYNGPTTFQLIERVFGPFAMFNSDNNQSACPNSSQTLNRQLNIGKWW